MLVNYYTFSTENLFLTFPFNDSTKQPNTILTFKTFLGLINQGSLYFADKVLRSKYF